MNLKPSPEVFDVKSLETEIEALSAQPDYLGKRTRASSPLRRIDDLSDRRSLGERLGDDPEAVPGDNPEPPGEVPPAAPDGSVESILTERAKTHGDFTDNARIAQDLKRIVHTQVGWDKLTDVQREALHMILHKIARIMGGNPNVKDHWDDIAGYAKLASERIKE